MRNNQHDPGCAEVQLEVREGEKEGGATRVAVFQRPPAKGTYHLRFSGIRPLRGYPPPLPP